MGNRVAVALLVSAGIGVVVGVVYFFGSGRRPASTSPAVEAPPAARSRPDPRVKLSPPPPLPPTPPSILPPAPPPVFTPAPDLPPARDPETAQSDPRLLIPPVEEPEMPLDAKSGENYGYVALPNGGGFVFERPDGGKRIGGVVIPATVLITRGIVELFGCGEGGKEHETIVRLNCELQSLDTALTLARLKRGKLPEKLDITEPDQGSRVLILVQWEDKQGKTVTHRSEDLIVSVKRERPMPRVGWTYVGRWNDVIDPSNPAPDKRHKVLACTASKSVVTTFRDETALLDNPLPEADDDTQFAANFMVLPSPGTPVRVIFRGATEAERGEIARLEKEIVK